MMPVFVLFFLMHWYAGAFIIFALASFTDLIDGTVARLSRKHSQIGAFLDPLADKLLMLATFACLVHVRILPTWFLVLAIIRDVFIIMGGLAVLKLLKIEVRYEPFWSSKFATLAQITLGLLSLGFLWNPTFHFGVFPIDDFIAGTTMVTAVLIIVTGLQYLRKGLEIIESRS